MSASSAPGQSKSSPKSLATPIVFVVDDDISVREIAGVVDPLRGLAARDIRVQHRNSLHTPRALVPSCLVLDFSLPGLNGLELQKRVRLSNGPTCQSYSSLVFGDVPMTVAGHEGRALRNF